MKKKRGRRRSSCDRRRQGSCPRPRRCAFAAVDPTPSVSVCVPALHVTSSIPLCPCVGDSKIIKALVLSSRTPPLPSGTLASHCCRHCHWRTTRCHYSYCSFSSRRAPSSTIEVNNRMNGKKGPYHDRQKRERSESYPDSMLEDYGDFHIDQSPKEIVEQASLDKQLTSSNVGFRLLQKMGWKGRGLGKDEQGIVEPIKAGMRDAKLGVGKQEEDDFFTAEENVQRRKLDIEVEESEELAKKREVVAEREQKIQTEVKEIRKVFFCELCNKQYKLAMEFEAHLSSYDHNHKKRFKEMREMHGSSSRDDRQKRELIRQEKEFAKFAQMADAQKQQRQQQQEDESVASGSSTMNIATPVAVQDQRQALKFGFSSKVCAAKKKTSSSVTKKPKVACKVLSVFGVDSDEES